MVIQPRFDLADDFHMGMARVVNNDGHAYIDKVGNFVIPPHSYDFLGEVNEGLIRFSRRENGSEMDGKSNQDASSGLYPTRPIVQTGVVTCRTQCINSDCYRTYSNGAHVHFQTPMAWNPITNQMEFSSGGC